MTDFPAETANARPEHAAPEWDGSDDEPMISHTERFPDGTYRIHRVKVSEWPAYSARHGL